MAVRRTGRENEAAVINRRINKSLPFRWNIRGGIGFLDYVNDYKRLIELSALDKHHFIMVINGKPDIIHLIERDFKKHIRGYMNIDGFVELLKDIGVNDASINDVRDKLLENLKSNGLSGLSITWSIDPEIPEKAAIGKHSERILREDHGDEPGKFIRPDSAAVPVSWEEAKAIVPALRKWVDVKREAGLTSRRKKGFDQEIYDLVLNHLRDDQTGLGKWVTSEQGMPRNLLRHVDSGLLQELYGLENPELPSDVRLPQGAKGRPIGSTDFEKRAFAPRPNQQPRAPRTPQPTAEELREAWRVAKRGQRRATI